MSNAQPPASLLPKRLLTLVALGMSAYQLTVAWIGEPTSWIHLPLHLSFALTVLIWLNPSRWPGRWRIAGIGWDIVVTALVISASLYLYLNYSYVQQRMVYVDALTPLELLLASGLIVAILDAARRTIGWVIAALVVVFLLYAYLGNNLPPPFWHRGYSVNDILETAYLTHDGIWGTPLSVTASFIFLFVLFGSFLLTSGAGDFFTDFARSLTRRTIGGPAKASVVSSIFMGMLSGSSAANVVTTGSFTIPTMKRVGYPAHFAGGVEAVASSGGQFTPPIMGAAAFIMMEFVGVPYLTIMQIAIIPAALYFLSVFCMVDLETRRLKLAAGADEALAGAWSIMRKRGYLFLPILGMIFALVQGNTPARAALYAIAMLLVLVVVFDSENRRRFFRVVIDGMDMAPRVIGPVTTACAVGGLILGMVTLTGLGVRMSSITLDLAGNSLPLLLVLTMLVSLILGMGMPTSSAYIILAALLAPGLVQFGVPVLAAHMFVMYCAAASSITPPVAVASYAASAIAHSDPWRTSLVAFKLGLCSFIIPYMFVYGPSLLTLGTPLSVAVAVLSGGMGIFLLSVALIGWLFTDLALWARGVYLAAALLMIVPERYSDVLGLALGLTATIAAYRYTAQRRERRPARSPETSPDSG